MHTRHNTLLSIMAGLFAICVSLSAFAQTNKSGADLTLTFQGDEYHHRWSKQGQNEFTPSGQEDLAQWRNMLTINVHEKVVNEEQLAAAANNTLGLYQENGEVLHTDSKPRTADSPAEHFMAGAFAQPNVAEAAFSRFILRDGVGVVVVYSQRFYGENAQDEMLQWVKGNGDKVEDALMTWQAIPTLKALKELPQT